MSISSSPLTVVHVSTQKSWHGGEGQALLLARGLRQRGHRCVVLARRDGEFAKRLASEFFEVHTFRRRGRGPDSLWKMHRLLSTLRPDVIHAHDSHALTVGGLAAMGLNVPLRVASRRVDFPIHSTAKFRRLADVVIAISTAVADICRQGGISERALRIVHSGVDPARIASGNRARGRTALKIDDETPLLVVVAKLTPHKGHEYLLSALPAVIQRYPQLRVALVGDGELVQALKAQTSHLSLDANVMFLGYRDDVPDLIKAADLFVMPSYMEGLCTSLLDAMFAGVPIVTTGAGGIADVVAATDTNGPYAFLAPPQDHRALADAILTALSSPAQSARIAASAQRRAQTLFGHDQMVDGTLDVYREWLARDRSHAA